MITDENETNVINNVRVLIFRVTDNSLEVDTSLITSYGNPEITIPLVAGSKRLFAIANAGDGMLPVKGSANNYADFSGAIYNISNTNPVSDPTTGIDNLSNLVKPTGYVMTNSTMSSLIGIDAGISAADSQDPSGINHVSIGLQRAVAKVAVSQSAGVSSLSTLDGSGTLSDLKYSVTNVNRSLYLFQNYDASSTLLTPEYIPTSYPDPDSYYYYYRFYNYHELLARNLPPTKGMFIYITENNPSVKMAGNTTFIAIEAVFKPKQGYFTKDINYNEISGAFTVTLSGTDLATASDIYRFTRQGVTGLNEGTLLAGVDAGKLARKVTYHLLNPTTPPKASLDDPVYAAITDSQVEAYFAKYIDGKCYYRVNIGRQSGVGDQIDYTVRRNHYYDVEITGYLRIGVSQMRMLVEPESEVIIGPTNITASFNVLEWIGEAIYGNG
jgi:hypothetical protein